MQRASWSSLGLRRIWPPGQSTIGSSSGDDLEALDQRLRAGVVSQDRGCWYGWPLRRRKLTSRSTSALASSPTMIGPAPVSISPTRRRIKRAHQAARRDRLLRSARRAIAQGESRPPRHRSGPSRSTRYGRPDSCASSPMKLPRSCVTMCVGSPPLRLGHIDLARQDQHQSGAGLADPREHVARLVTARLTETGEPRDFLVGEAQEHLRSAGRVGIGELDRSWLTLVSARKE